VDLEPITQGETPPETITGPGEIEIRVQVEIETRVQGEIGIDRAPSRPVATATGRVTRIGQVTPTGPAILIGQVRAPGQVAAPTGLETRMFRGVRVLEATVPLAAAVVTTAPQPRQVIVAARPACPGEADLAAADPEVADPGAAVGGDKNITGEYL
jgi:hypothetical protein